MGSSNLRSVEAKAFVPARDFELSKRFDEAVGFTLEWSTSDLACFRHNTSSFLLQNFHVREHTANFQMHLLVEKVDEWRRHISAAVAQFGIKVEEPQDRQWGLRDFALSDPSGVLWRIGQPLAK